LKSRGKNIYNFIWNLFWYIWEFFFLLNKYYLLIISLGLVFDHTRQIKLIEKKSKYKYGLKHIVCTVRFERLIILSDFWVHFWLFFKHLVSKIILENVSSPEQIWTQSLKPLLKGSQPLWPLDQQECDKNLWLNNKDFTATQV
jgi:hypothetical protein